MCDSFFDFFLLNDYNKKWNSLILFFISLKNDIFSSQQHFKALTKTKKNSIRILTNYATMEMSVENLKFNVSDINDILLYIQQRYPNLLVSADTEHAEFENGDKIYFAGNQVLETIDRDIIIDPETNKIIDKKNPNSNIKQQRFEFLFDFILTKIHEVNPEDNLTKTKKSIPYISLYMSGLKIPLIIYAWYQYGLLTALNRFSIDYSSILS